LNSSNTNFQVEGRETNNDRVMNEFVTRKIYPTTRRTRRGNSMSKGEHLQMYEKMYCVNGMCVLQTRE